MKSQVQKIYKILLDGLPHRTDEFQERIFGSTKYGLFRLSARIWDIKNKYNVEIESWKDKEIPSLWWYQIKQKDTLFNIPENKVVSDQDVLKYR